MATRTITAYFDTVQEAERAALDLGTRVGGVRGEVFDARTGTGGLGALPDEDTALLAEGFRRGGGVVHAEVPDDRSEAVADALEAAGAVDLDEREAQWRREGWTGGATAGGATAGTATAGAAGTASTTARAATATGIGQGDEAIPIVEERLTVGKREVNRGRVRVRSYVVETPVQEQVSLRQEHVEVERRTVDRPVTDADRLFQERTIEATESAEEAVVAKEARVVEELVVRKEAEERVQTVQDTVRRTEVEVEDDRRAAGTTTTTGTTTTGTTGTPSGPDRR